jgi:hypothetical protein
LCASVAAYQHEVQGRRPVDAAIARFELDQRRPADVEVLGLQPSADLRASFFSHMTLTDVYAPVSLARLSAEERGRWIRSLSTLDHQLEEARELTLDALECRPGWAFHHAYVGEIEYAALRRRSVQAAADGHRRWEVPLLNGMAEAPGNVSFPTYLGGAYIETWGLADLVGDPREVLGRAMKSTVFVERNYRLVGLILGRETLMDLLPDDPRLLRVAFAREARDGEVEAAAALRARIDDAERRERAAGLESIRERARLGDIEGQLAAARGWVSRHRPEDLDDAAGRAEVAEVLALWPASKRGSWVRDPRAELVRFFLSGREADVDGATLESTVAMLTNVPDPVRARVAALAGETWEAERMLRESRTAGSFEWTPVIVDLVRGHLAEGKEERAREVIRGLSRSALAECNVLLALRALGDDGDGDQLEALAPSEVPAAMWSRSGALSLCFDPDRHADAKLVVALSSPSALVSYGWDGGRVGSLVVKGEAVLELPLSGMEGRHSVRVVTEAGLGVTIDRTEILTGRK